MSGDIHRSLVIGAGGSLGRAIATRLGRRGDRVGLLGRDLEKLGRAAADARDAGGKPWVAAADVLDRPNLAAAIEGFETWAGGLDHLVFAAGRFRAIGPIDVCDPDDWRLDLETSMLGAFHSVRESLVYLGQSTRPTISILVGPGYQKAIPHGSSYCSAQAGLVRLVETLSIELAPRGIPVHAVFPGIALSGLTSRLLDSAEGRAWLPGWTETFAEGKEVEPNLVGEMIVWLTERRPLELSGRVVFATMPPELLETRLASIREHDRHKLRLT